MTERYFWLKLFSDFFSQTEIKFLRQRPHGDKMCIIFLKLLLKTMNQHFCFQFKGLGNSIDDELAVDLNEPAEDIRKLIEFMTSCGWISEDTTDTDATLYHILNSGISVGSESESAQRMRKKRAKDSSNTQQTVPSHCDGSASHCDGGASHCDTEKRRTETEKTRTETEQNRRDEASHCDENASQCDASRVVVAEHVTVMQKAKELEIPPSLICTLVAEFTSEKVNEKLSLLKDALVSSNIRNKGAWLRAALQNDYKPIQKKGKPVANPHCPICGGTGKVKCRVDNTSQIITVDCKCVHRQ